MTVSSPPSIKGQVRHSWLLAVVVGMAAVLLFYQLGIRTLEDWDEAIYAQISREIVNRGDWLTLHWGNNPWFHKPPLFMWMTASAYKLFGVSEFSARVTSAFAGLGVVVLTYLIGQRLYGQAAAMLATIVLLTNFTFVHFARFGTTDVTLTLFIFTGIYAYLRAAGSQKPSHSRLSDIGQSMRGQSMSQSHSQAGQGSQWWYLFWVATAAALMTKGVAGLSLPIATAIALVIDGRLKQTIGLRSFWVGGVLAVLLVLPWHVMVIYQHGQAFIDQYILYHVVERATGGITAVEGHQGGVDFYFRQLGKNFFPWVWLLPMAFVLQVKDALAEVNRGLKPEDPARSNRILWGLVLVVFGGFTLAGTKLSWYIIPCYPVLSIWIGHFISVVGQQSGQAIKDKGSRFYKFAFLSLIFAAAAVCVLTPQKVVFLSPAVKSVVALAGLLGLLLTVGLLLWLLKDKARSRKMVVLLLCSVFVLSGLREIRGLYLAVNDPVPQLAEQAGDLTGGTSSSANADGALTAMGDQNLIVISLSERLFVPTAMFYSNRPIYWVRDVDELESIAAGDAILAKKDIELLSLQYDIQVLSEARKLAYAKITRR